MSSIFATGSANRETDEIKGAYWSVEVVAYDTAYSVVLYDNPAIPTEIVVTVVTGDGPQIDPDSPAGQLMIAEAVEQVAAR